MTPRGWLVAAWSVAGVTFALATIMVVLMVLNGGEIGVVGFALPFLTFGVVGGIIAARQPRNRVAWLLLGIPFGITGYAACHQYALYAFVTRPGSLPAADIVAWIGATLWVPSALLVLVFLPLLFPDGRVLSPRWRWVGWIALAAASGIVVPGQFLAWSVRGPALLDEEAWTEPIAVLVGLLFVVMMTCGLAAFTSLVVRYRRGGPERRAQLRWFASAVGLLLVTFVVTSVLLVEENRIVDYVVFPLVVSTVPVALGFAVSRYRLYEIDRLVRRGVIYVTVTAILVGIYAAVVVGAQRLLAPVTSGSDLAVAASTLVVAAAFGPVRRRVQAAIDRRFDRSRFDAMRTVEAFGQRLRDEIDPAELSDQVVAVVSSALRPGLAQVWLVDGKAGR